MDRAAHTLHESADVQELQQRFESRTGYPIRAVVDRFVLPSAPKAVFAAGSIPLGMGASGSDIDLIVMVDDESAITPRERQNANTPTELEFASSSNLLLPGIFLSMHEGVLVDLHVAVTPVIHGIYARLRRRGPDLNETEMRTLGRLASGWLVFETQGYLAQHGSVLKDTALPVYCCTKQFVSALHEISKARRALACADSPLALHHACRSIENAYLAWFASEGMTYLGAKWLAQVGYARGAAERMARYPLLAAGIPLLFPRYPASVPEITVHLNDVANFLKAMKALIEEKTLYRIAFKACAQMHDL
jgi:hypothetical protein